MTKASGTKPYGLDDLILRLDLKIQQKSGWHALRLPTGCKLM
jgi:hypothetical protein